MKSPAHQRGIALITAILIVSLAVIAATAILTAGNLSIQRTATLQETERAWWYATGVEAWVKTILQRDAKDNRIDSLGDIWAQPVQALPIEQGFLSGEIVDLQGRLNLNNFAASDPAAFEQWQQVLIRLFEQIKLEPALAKPISESLRDWVDQDQNPTPYDGAEDGEYLSQKPAYRAANRPMLSVTELMAIKGVTPEIYSALLPYVTALPKIGTAINVNTAPEPLLRALSASPSAAFEDFVRQRVEKPAEQVTELFQNGTFTANDVKTTMLDVKSDFFQLRAQATIGSSRVAIYSLYLRRSASTLLVLSRSTDSE
jgi:general secretion pathway protein K